MKKHIFRLARHVNLVIASSVGAAQLYLFERRTEKLKLKLEYKIDGVPLRIPPKIKNLVVEVMNDMKVEKDKFDIEPFVIQGLDLKYFGSPTSKTKSFLGIPLYFSFEDEYDVNFIALIEKETIPKDSLDYKIIRDSLFLSKDAKKFGIARELYEFLNSKFPFKTALPTLVLLCCNILSIGVDVVLKHLPKPPYKIHGAIYFLGIVMYFLIYSFLSSYEVVESDFLASELGKSYLKGGIEYYEKMIERNKMMKKFFKDIPYTEDGDSYNVAFNTTQMPLSRRVSYLKDFGEVRNKPIWSFVFYFN